MSPFDWFFVQIGFNDSVPDRLALNNNNKKSSSITHSYDLTMENKPNFCIENNIIFICECGHKFNPIIPLKLMYKRYNTLDYENSRQLKCILNANAKSRLKCLRTSNEKPKEIYAKFISSVNELLTICIIIICKICFRF